MGDTDSLREQYDRFVQDIYRDILKKKGFGKAHGAFVKIENGIVRSVEFTCYPDKKSKKKDTLMFRICVEARLENETQLRREGKLTTGEGAYRKFFQDCRNKISGLEDCSTARKTCRSYKPFESRDRQILQV